MDKVISRIANQAGADVHILQHASAEVFGWRCTGCHDGETPDLFTQTRRLAAMTRAERHAGICRFQPAQS